MPFKKLKVELPCDLAIPLQEVYLKEMKQRDAGMSMCAAELHTRTKAWNWQQHVPLSEWMRQMCYIYLAEYYKTIKINASLSLPAMEMELDTIE